jgi:hypothetical protein
MCGVKSSVAGPGFCSKEEMVSLISQSKTIFIVENYDFSWVPIASIYGKDVIFWSIDNHLNIHEHLKFIEKIKPSLILFSNIVNLDLLKNTAIPIAWMPNAIDSDLFLKPPPPPLLVHRCVGIGFCGSLIGNRIRWLTDLAKSVPVSIRIGALGGEMIRSIKSFRISLNLSINNDLNYRLFESTACAALLLTNKVPGIEKIFVPDREIVVYDTVTELKSKIRYFLENLDHAQSIATNGYERTKSCHTYIKRVETIISLITMLK